MPRTSAPLTLPPLGQHGLSFNKRRFPITLMIPGQLDRFRPVLQISLYALMVACEVIPRILAHLLLKTIHNRQHRDQRHYTQHDAEQRGERNKDMK